MPEGRLSSTALRICLYSATAPGEASRFVRASAMGRDRRLEAPERRRRNGKLLKPARVTVFHNGVLAQDNVEPSGPTAHGERPPYKPGPDKAPLALQDHGNPVRYRNIWIRLL